MRRGAALAATAGVAVAMATGTAFADFPGGDPDESPRVNTPNDPSFDRCEPDDETTPDERECTSYFDEQFELFGFAPASSTARYLDPSQLDERGRRANEQAGRPPNAQISGVRADLAWKYSTGSPDVTIAILDTGIRWEEPELVEKVHLNVRELPPPEGAASHDANGDGKVSVGDYADDPRVREAAGDTESDSILDASDLIATFSDGVDADGNGYVDDIAGWDFFDDDNDPFDVSSCCSSVDHGTGRALEAARATDDGRGGAGLCPDCRIMPLRVWDTFVVPTDLYALGVVYAADNGASVVEGAVGGLTNSQFARRAFEYADGKGVALMLVSSDLNTANHNYPTNYNEAVYVAGTLPDTAPAPDCAGCEDLLEALRRGSGGAFEPSSQPPTTSFFRNSNLTQYGGKADIVLVGSTGSQNTGQAAGAAGLVQSYGRERLGTPLSGNEVRQLLTTTAEDVLPANTGQIGLPDKANPGWDPHFGYGRVRLDRALERIRQGRIPPEAQIDSPDWFAPIEVGSLGRGGVPIAGRAAAPHSAAGVGAWEVEYACGQDALDSSFEPLPAAHGRGARDGVLGRLTPRLLRRLAEECDGSIANDPGLPAGDLANPDWPADPYPDPDPHRHAFQIRLTVHEAGDPENVGVYRKTLFAYRDGTLLDGWPQPLGSGSDRDRLVTGSGGEAPPRLADLDGDGRLDVLLPTSSGELHVLGSDGRPRRFWNGGEPVLTDVLAVAAAHERPEGSLGGNPREPLRAPAVGDVTGDGEPEVVATAGEHVYAWSHEGEPLPGFPRRIDPALSAPCEPGAAKPCFDAGDRAITRDNHVKRGFIGSAALADLDGDGVLDVVAGSLDQHVYAFDGSGASLPGFPAKLASEGAAGAEIVTSPAIADLDGNGDPEVVLATNEVVAPRREPPRNPLDLVSALFGGAGGFAVVYALHGDGTLVDGWPVRLGALLPDALPLVGPGHDAAALDVDGDGDDEVVVSAATAQARIVDGDGSTIVSLQTAPAAGDNTDPAAQVNLFEYPSIGDLLGTGRPVVLKGGLSLNGVLNLAAPNQNLPFNHSVQAWSPETGAYLPGFPVATDDYQLLSQPSVAKVGGPGPVRQALVGTGLYQLHAYGPGGVEPPGWPKFTGGWVFAPPVVGDVDGDGGLDVLDLTREGWVFLWETDAPACLDGGANADWNGFHHDLRGTANYGVDARPPSRPGAASARSTPGGDVLLSFEGAGDDLACGAAARYEVRGSDEPIRNGADFERAERLRTTRAPLSLAAVTDGRVRLAVRGGARFDHLAVRAVDDAGNLSALRRLAP